MKRVRIKYAFFCAGLLINVSCAVIDQSSRHDFESGYYRHRSDRRISEKAYLDINENQVVVYPVTQRAIGKPNMTIPLGKVDSVQPVLSRFRKQSLDIDITTVLLKYRPATSQVPTQLSPELNVALYSGWRHDYYRIKGKTDPLGSARNNVVKRGWDIGALAGIGTTPMGPTTTINAISKEYNGMLFEYGLAAFVETSFASFGVAIGYDHLIGPDREIWIYHQKPWFGFVVGIALN
jgi:hypothetical protein